MPRFGAHLSIAGGLHQALLAAQRYGFTALQLFTKSPSQWSAAPLNPEEIKAFRSLRRQLGLPRPIVHDAYLINLATPDDTLWRRSVEAFVDEIRRADAIEASDLVFHPGAHSGDGESKAVRRVIEALNEVTARSPDSKVRLLLETTAGQGSTIGHRFEHLAEILAGLRVPKRFGVCFDTCHVFAAGYSLSPESEYRRTMCQFDRIVGLRQIRVFHLNDSKRELGSRVDRHAHLGRGFLGLEPFRLLVNDRRFQTRSMIMETPKENLPEVGDMDAENFRVLQDLWSPSEAKSG
jgi:deoxyribonuclease-4